MHTNKRIYQWDKKHAVVNKLPSFFTSKNISYRFVSQNDQRNIISDKSNFNKESMSERVALNALMNIIDGHIKQQKQNVTRKEFCLLYLCSCT